MPQRTTQKTCTQTNTFTLNFQHPELGKVEFLLCKPPRPWYFMATMEKIEHEII